MSKTAIVDKRRSCACAIASAPTLKGPALPPRRGLGVAMTKLAGRSCCSGMTVGAPACHNHGVSEASSPT
jgi:hypothetical protein